MDCTKIITIEPDKRSGQLCIRGLRMTVRDVLEYLAGGMMSGTSRHIPKDITAARKWLDAAASAGDYDARRALNKLADVEQRDAK